MQALKAIGKAIVHLLYPNVCAGCGSDAVVPSSRICIRCLQELPTTGFEKHVNNPIEKIFAGRLSIEEASAHFYFSKKSALQHMLHQFKYGGDQELGQQLGVEMGKALLASGRFKNIDLIIPMPLFAARERQRGYNQSMLLCKGVASILKRPVDIDVVRRQHHTDTQTHKSRIERWQNMQNVFKVIEKDSLHGKHLLLIDDVITTGATLEACGSVLKNIQNVKLSIAALCFAND